jgi:hypothetical protein
LPLAPLEFILAILALPTTPRFKVRAALSSPTPLLSPPLITSISLTTALRPNTTTLRHTHYAETSSSRANYYYALIPHRRTRLPHGSGSQLSPLQASCIPQSTAAPLNRARRLPPDILVTTPTRRPRATTASPQSPCCVAPGHAALTSASRLLAYHPALPAQLGRRSRHLTKGICSRRKERRL